MKTLRVNALSGIKNQLYCPEQYIKPEKKKGIQSNFFDINSLFWSSIFDSEHISDLTKRTCTELKNDHFPKVQAVIGQPEMFYEEYRNSLEILDELSDVPLDTTIFQALETLEIICFLHTRLYSGPFVLTLPQGYAHSKYSALDMEHNCLLPFCNPYLEFINTQVIPAILEYNPDVLILTGVPNLASFAIAKLVKAQIPNVFIVSSDHESDYYSLQKISELLVSNSAFFSVYHCITLISQPSVVTKIQQWYIDKTNCSLDDVPNLIYSLDCGKTIIKTKESNIAVQAFDSHIHNIQYVYNMRAFPDNHCYWNKCSFCGINSKYGNTLNCDWDVGTIVSRIKELSAKGASKIWFLDEAIPVTVLNDFALQLAAQNVSIEWHIRTRIEPSLSECRLAKLLARVGLRHIILGFESASARVLALMEKTSGDFDYLEVAEQIVSEFTAEGIQVHFSTIFGFPTETKEERNETAMFLCYLHDTYKLFSYNVNPFYLDIGSKVYQKWERYDITALSFPCSPKYFLENHLNWNSAVAPDRANAVRTEKDSLMKRQYPWYSDGSLIEPGVFFAFWEFGRFPLQGKSSMDYPEQAVLDKSRIIILSPQLSICQLNSESWLFYNLANHHYVIGGYILCDLIAAGNLNISFNTFLNMFKGTYQDKVETLLTQMNWKGFFV